MKTILLSRTDKIGDVILTLPMAGMIKKHFPEYKVLFLAREYTMDIARRCADIDRVYDVNMIKKKGDFPPHVDYFIHVFPDLELSWLARLRNVKYRIGTSHRIYHWFTCNRLVGFTRKRSDLHESQLNMKLLRPLGINEIPNLTEMHQYVQWEKAKHFDATKLLTQKFNLIFHMKSLGSAKEWPLTNYLKLAQALPADGFQIFLSGTLEEGEAIKKEVPEILTMAHVADVTGKFNLENFTSFIEQCDGLLACSTGPLHIASIAGIKTLGLYPANRPIHAGRWAPIGKNSQTLSEKIPGKDISLNIKVDDVKHLILDWKR